MKINKIFGYIAYLTVVSLFMSLLVYVFMLTRRAVKFYDYVKVPTRGWEGNLHQGDDRLGYRSIPGASGYEVFEGSKKITMRYDDEGFRVPVFEYPADYGKHPLFLFLGCSFTFGSACLAEEAYPYLVGENFNGKSINAGAVSYGFSQMLMLARDLIPKYKPDFVVLQCSPWLVKRSMAVYRPTAYGSLPMPYFGKMNGDITLVAPPFKTNIFDLPVSRYKHTEKSFYDFLSFMKNVAIPFYIHDDYHRFRYKIMVMRGERPGPTYDGLRVERYIYKEVYDLCRKYNAKMVMLFVGVKGLAQKDFDYARMRKDLIMVDAETALWNRLEDPVKEEYDKAYKHWKPDRSAIVDHHPNSRAHKIIAGEINKMIAGNMARSH